MPVPSLRITLNLEKRGCEAWDRASGICENPSFLRHVKLRQFHLLNPAKLKSLRMITWPGFGLINRGRRRNHWAGGLG